MNNRTSALLRAQNHLKDLYHESRKHTGHNQRSWHWVAQQIGLSVGTVIRVARNGYEPRTPRIRQVLGLPIYIMSIACIKCGKLHDQLKTCPDKRKRRRVLHLHELPTADIARRLRERFVYAPSDEQRATVETLVQKREQQKRNLKQYRSR